MSTSELIPGFGSHVLWCWCPCRGVTDHNYSGVFVFSYSSPFYSQWGLRSGDRGALIEKRGTLCVLTTDILPFQSFSVNYVYVLWILSRGGYVVGHVLGMMDIAFSMMLTNPVISVITDLKTLQILFHWKKILLYTVGKVT